jgi:hypothetical protein
VKTYEAKAAAILTQAGQKGELGKPGHAEQLRNNKDLDNILKRPEIQVLLRKMDGDNKPRE